MALRAAAWVAWAVWTCKTCGPGCKPRHNGDVRKERASARSFRCAGYVALREEQ